MATPPIPDAAGAKMLGRYPASTSMVDDGALAYVRRTMSGAPNLEQTVPFFLVADIAASVRFYTEGLGYAMTRTWEPDGQLTWCSLEREGTAFMLQQFGREDPRRSLPSETLGVGVTICIFCADALAIYRELTARGIAASRPFVGNGMWVTSVRDPDGYRLDFESTTDAVEETVYEG